MGPGGAEKESWARYKLNSAAVNGAPTCAPICAQAAPRQQMMTGGLTKGAGPPGD